MLSKCCWRRRKQPVGTSSLTLVTVVCILLRLGNNIEGFNDWSPAFGTTARWMLKQRNTVCTFPLPKERSIKSVEHTFSLHSTNPNEDNRDWNLQQRNLRFSGVGKLYSPVNEEAQQLSVVDRLAESTVTVIGIGGIGSWSVEALCRSGVGNIIMIDLDDICISNSNRQLHALSGSIGKFKTHVMKDRLLDINPDCNVTLVETFVTAENVDDILKHIGPMTALIDAIDGQHEKCALIAACAKRKIPIVTVGGAAGRVDPTKIIYGDLTKAHDDRLLGRCRKVLRQSYGFEQGPPNNVKNNHRPKKWNITAVFSSEKQKAKVDKKTSGSLRTCDGYMGTACFVTGTYGFVAASEVVRMIAEDDLQIPLGPS